MGTGTCDTTEIRNLLVEWRDARIAFLASDHGQPSTFETRKPLFDRLANAEGALMAYACLVR